MILREGRWLLSFHILLLSPQLVPTQRTYDTNDWIPITPRALQTSASEIVEQKLPSDRVLNLETPPEQKFFPEQDYRKRTPNQVQQFLRESPPKKVASFEQPRPRKLKHRLVDYKFDAPPAAPHPPAKTQPNLHFYNPQYTYDNYVPVPSVNPRAPAPNAPDIYEQYQLPFNASFYQSLNPGKINNEFYQAINTNKSVSPPKEDVEQESVQLVYVPVESLKPTTNNLPQESTRQYQTKPLSAQTSGQQLLEQPRQQFLEQQYIEQPRQQFLEPKPQFLEQPRQQFVDTSKQQFQQESKFLEQPRQQFVDTPKQQFQQESKFLEQPRQQFVDTPKQQFQESKPHFLEQPKRQFLDTPKQQFQESKPHFLEQPRQQFHQYLEQPVEQPTTRRPLRERPRQQQFLEPSNQQYLFSTPAAYPQYLEPQPVQEKLVAPQPSETPKQHRLDSIQRDYVQQAFQAHRLQEQLKDEINPLKQHEVVITTEKPKLKPHQPPLAVFLESQHRAEIADVLNILKGAETIAVQDSISPNSPRIFIGPSNIDSPDGYTKFPLPYLNNINGNRIERKIDQLPFFVAPVSYNAPPGYAKIPLPSPHVGSVVVSVPLVSSTTSTTTTPTSLLYNQYSLPSGGSDPSTYDLLSPTRAHQPPDAYPAQSYTPERGNLYSPVPINQEEAAKPPLPNAGQIDLAIKEFELQQINDGLNSEHVKVKHSTTRRPAYESESVRTPTRGRYSFSEEPSTERTVSRGRVRGRGRATTTTTTTSTTTTTTTTTPPAPLNPDRYTVLEQFEAQTEASSPEDSFRSALSQTDSPRRSTTTFTGSRYLPEEYFDSSRPQSPIFDYEVPKLENSSPRQPQLSSKVYTAPEYDFEASFKPTSSTPSRLFYENIEEVTTPSNSHRFRPTEAQVTPSYENREPNQGRLEFETDVDDVRRPLYRQPETYEKPPATTTKEPTVEDQNAKQSAEEPSSSFLNNLFQPNFDQTYISLQDQAVRSLLVPNLLAPSTKLQTPSSTTEAAYSTTTSTPRTTTTTSSSSRIRGRVRGRPASVSVSTTTSAPRRASNAAERRRPAVRTSTTERPTTEYTSLREDAGGQQLQRFRTRGRPLQQHNEITTTTEAILERNYEPVNSQEFVEPVVDQQQIVTIRPDFVPQVQIQEQQQPAVLEYDNTRPLIEEEDFRKVNFVPKKTEEPVVKYNIKSAGVLNNNDNRVQTTTSRTRGRTRGRSRFASTTAGTTTSTSRPALSRVSSVKPPQEEEEEFYGFTRQPAFTPTKLNIQAIPQEEATSPVKFVGEIRPKYTPRVSTTSRTFNDEDDTPTTRTPRIRARTRSRTKAPEEEQVTRRAGTAGRTRGRTQYRAPENVKRESEDEDVADQNYPVNFLQKLDGDQTPSPSLYTPRWVLPNSLDDGAKKPNSEEPLALAVELTTQTMSQLIEENQEVVRRPGRRKGSWKLVRSRPADPLDGQESQNYQTVLNSFDTIEKVNTYQKSPPRTEQEEVVEESITVKEDEEATPTTTPSPAKTQENIFDTIYEMFGVFSKGSSQTTTENQNATTITPAPTVFPEEITDDTPTTTLTVNKTPEEIKTETTTEFVTETTLPTKPSTQNEVVTSTSTSTEVSQETEICYKGRCVKSKKDKKRRPQ